MKSTVAWCWALLLVLPALQAGDDVPSWLRETAASELPAYPGKVPAAELLHEESVTVDGTGRKVRTTRRVVKILNREGASKAVGAEEYFTDGGKVTSMKAWLLMPSGRTKTYGKAETLDLAIGSGLYEEARIRAISASSDADPGSVFGFESVVEEKSIFTQFEYSFQDALPAVRSVFVVNLPTGWKAEAKLQRGNTVEPMEAEVSGSSYRWTMKALPSLEREPGSPLLSTMAPQLLVSTFPGDGAKDGHFQTWHDVATWSNQFYEAPFRVTPDIEAHAKQVAGAATTFWDRVKLLAEDAQKIRYESVQLKLSRGGGYTPRPASSVMTKAWGDCKDKANYLRTMLKAMEIEAYPVTIYSGDPLHTRKEWPSPYQFNHAIVAIHVPDEVAATLHVPAMFDYPGIGKMVLFDPTDDMVTLGSIPEHEQDSWALLVAPEKGDLFRTPPTLPSQNRLVREAKVKVDGDGNLTASYQETGIGQQAFSRRATLKGRTPREYSDGVSKRVAAYVSGAMISRAEPNDDATAGTFQLALDFSAAGYAKTMQGRLMMVRPFVLGYAGVPSLAEKERSQPLLVHPAAFHERIEFEIPEGFAVDEMPEAGHAESDFGTFKSSVKTAGNKVILERDVELRRAWIPVEQFSKARRFFGVMGSFEQSPLVLVRK